MSDYLYHVLFTGTGSKDVMLNPLTHFLIIFRECVLYEENISIKILGVGVLETFIMLGIGIYVFGKRQDKFIMDI